MCIRDSLDLDLPGRKVVVGSGPQEAALKRRYPDALFTGPMQGEDLARAYASADVFVFPSHTDTFGWCCWRRSPRASRSRPIR